MGNIYANANKVHVWLGPATDKNEICVVFNVFKAQPNIRRNTGESISSSALAALSKFLTRSWFTRRWVLQEVALGHTVIVHCGDQKLAWDWFRVGAKLLHTDFKRTRNHDRLPTHDLQTLENLVTLNRVKMEREGRSGKRGKESYDVMLGRLWVYHITDCTNERDRLFSLYGMSPTPRWEYSPSPSRHCPVSYNTHFASVYTAFSKGAANTGYGNEILHHAIAFGNLANRMDDGHHGYQVGIYRGSYRDHTMS
jgi:hypothetical protein